VLTNASGLRGAAFTPLQCPHGLWLRVFTNPRRPAGPGRARQAHNPEERLVLARGLPHTAAMSEIAQFVRHGASQVTPRVLAGVHKKLPFLKIEFAQINAPKFPHLVDQLEFLADVVEDFAEGLAEDLPYVTVAAAVFALTYAHRQFDLIPDSTPDFGHADDSSVVRAVLIEHERYFSQYASKHNLNWAKITVKP
jgi:uncharacterized membrane protein YkvA (DUF1232 family)